MTYNVSSRALILAYCAAVKQQRSSLMVSHCHCFHCTVRLSTCVLLTVNFPNLFWSHASDI